ncbi:MAG TPA: hypothetical protein DEQ30_11565 [Porphyromonadaceae bacterium]|nr:hypothetical protein [Porphyromonadaceae bacterium]
MSNQLHTNETKRNVVAWLLRLGGLALAVTGVANAVQTGDLGTSAGLWCAGSVVAAAGDHTSDKISNK